MKTILISLLCIGMITTLSNCEKNTVESINKGVDINIKEDFSKQTSEFAFNFWRKMEKFEEKDKNYFISPLSLNIALGMLLNGSDTDTKTEIQKVLGLDGQSMEDINKTYKELIDNLPKVDPKVTNTIANSIWQNTNFNPEKDFINTLSAHFNAKLYIEDFGNPGTVTKINKWASDNTNAKIKKIIEDISPDQVMFLVNALYFKGDWTNKFDTKNTFKTEFDGAKSKTMVDMMAKQEKLNYADMSTYKVVQLPYGNEKYSMQIILPNDKNVDALIAKMNITTWDATQKKLVPTTVLVHLPKFKIEYSKKLNNMLVDMGMGKIFTSQADLSKISKPKGKLVVGFVKQDTYVAVDESGTEAAAVTSIGIETTSVPVYPEIFCNKPFAFVITEKTSNTILFIGKVSNL